MTSITALMAVALDRELRSRGLRLATADCEQILRLVIAGPAAIGRAYEASRDTSAPQCPPAEPPDGGCASASVASAVDFSSADRAAMARRFERASECRLHIRHDDDLMHRDDVITGAELNRLAAMIRGPSPSSAAPAPARTSDGGRDPSGDAPAVTDEMARFIARWTSPEGPGEP